MCPVIHSNIVFSWINYKKYFVVIIDYYLIEKSCTVVTLRYIYKLQNC